MFFSLFRFRRTGFFSTAAHAHRSGSSTKSPREREYRMLRLPTLALHTKAERKGQPTNSEESKPPRPLVLKASAKRRTVGLHPGLLAEAITSPCSTAIVIFVPSAKADGSLLYTAVAPLSPVPFSAQQDASWGRLHSTPSTYSPTPRPCRCGSPLRQGGRSSR